MQSCPVPLDEVRARVRERLTPAIFDEFDPKRVEKFFWVGLVDMIKEGGCAFAQGPEGIDSVCSAGDPWADALAWSTTWSLILSHRDVVTSQGRQILEQAQRERLACFDRLRSVGQYRR